LTTYGLIGIKVWICKGEVYGRRDLSPNVGMAAAAAKGGSNAGGGNRRPSGKGGNNRKKK
jgi:small subunit ribosomal protein S3